MGLQRPASVRRRAGLLGEIHPDDAGKKCLVLDLDETLVHSSFQVPFSRT
jgi:RNA polymerase II subunit A small phosphatase-like protein